MAHQLKSVFTRHKEEPVCYSLKMAYVALYKISGQVKET